jgi:uncharacterized repeat protein (TIGR03803 family)
MITNYFRKSVSIVLFLTLASLAAPAGTITYRFIVGTASYQQPALLTEVLPGVFYSYGASEVPFSVTPQGQLTSLANFNPGTLQHPFVTGANRRAYSTMGGASSNVVSVGLSPGTKRVYADLKLAAILLQNLPDGTLLGYGLNSTNYSLVKSDLQGTVTSFFQFPAGENVWSVLYATDGNYYGVSQPHNQYGYVFRLTPSGTLTKLLTIAATNGPLLQGTDGNLYGATGAGGANNTGTIYKLALSGQYTLLYSFTTGANRIPYWLIEGSDGNLYGTTYGNGLAATLFQVTTSGQYTLINTMAPSACACGLTLGSDGNIYGDASGGGPSGAGFIFAVEGGFPKPAPRALQFRPQEGAVGSKVRIWGYNLFYAAVQFNGVAATTVSNGGSNYVFATVPTGATTGPITVTTPGGTSTTTASFVVK